MTLSHLTKVDDKVNMINVGPLPMSPHTVNSPSVPTDLFMNDN